MPDFTMSPPVHRAGAHPYDDGPPVNACFHPGDAAALAEREPVRVCFHPGDDPASDLHRSLTGIDERHLAAVAGR